MAARDIDQPKSDIIVFGASGHAKVVIDIIEQQGLLNVVCLFDDNVNLDGQTVYGYRVFTDRAEILSREIKLCLVAIGDSHIRSEVASWLESQGIAAPLAAIHPSVALGRGSSIGMGTVIMAGSVVNSDTDIGRNTIINTGATVDHDCKIGNSVHVAPGVTICGGCSVGDLSLIGAGATILPNVKIGSNVIVGAGATVVRDVSAGETVSGTPARVMK